MNRSIFASQAVNKRGLIFDIGVSEGNDTAFYLAKGFRVVAVEADPFMLPKLRARFASDIASGSLKLLPFAASDSFGEVVEFHVHKIYQGTSGVSLNPDLDPNDYHAPCHVLTIDWATLLAQGTPRYVKIDIENNETPFLAGMALIGIVPEFISVECHALDPLHQLFALGYRRFKLVDQVPVDGFRMPDPQVEGEHVDAPNFAHASGPFGLDLFTDENWLDLDAFKEAWALAQPSRGARGTWFDCHAWMPAEKRLPRLVRKLLSR